jgi:hypothetical protein
MKTMKAFCLLACIGLIAGCSAVHGVKYDYSRHTDFGKYMTYDYMPVHASVDIDERVVERVKKAVDFQLSAKGLKRTTHNPDYLIAEHLAKKDRVGINDWGYDFGPLPGYWGGNWATGDIATYNYEEGTLILDFVDAGTKKLFWRGTANADIQNIDSPDESQTLINETVNKILQKYPPPAE